MTVRAQIFLFVAPLFIGCGVVGAAVGWRLQTAALDRAFDGQARALGATVAEFIEPGDVERLEAGEKFAGSRLDAARQRLDRWALVKRLMIFDAKSGRMLADTDPQDGPAPAPHSWRDLGPDELRLLPLLRSASGDERQPFASPAAGGRAVVVGELSAAGYLGARADILHDAVIDVAVAALIGLAVAAVASSFVSRQVRRVRQAVQTVGTPEFASKESGGAMQEVADLANTMNVMHSVLEDAVGKAHSVLIESERYLSERSLASALQGQLRRDAALAGGGMEGAWFSVGEPPPAAFVGLAATGPRRGAAFVGTAGSAEELGAVLRAQAVTAYLEDALRREPLEAAAAQACSLFGLERLSAAAWDENGFRLWSAGQEGPSEARPWGEAVLALSCLGFINGERAEDYAANFPARSPAETAAELPPLLDHAESGAMLVLRHAS